MGCANSKPSENASHTNQRTKKNDAKRGKKTTAENDSTSEPEKVVPKSTYAIYQKSHDAKLVGEKECALRGLTSIHSGHIIVADYKNNILKLFDSDFRYLHSLEFSSAPWDVCQSFEDPDDVFATVPYTKQVHSVMIDKTGNKAKLVIVDTFRSGGFCWGVTCFDGGIAVSIKVSQVDLNVPAPPPFQVDIYEYDGRLRRSITHDPDGTPYFLEPKYLNVTVDNLFLLVSDYKQNIVYCLNNEDELIYKYTGLKAPNGLAMDEFKNVHVVSFFGTRRVHKIGANGKYIDGLPHDDKRPLFPHSICYKKKDRSIVMTTEHSLEVYKLV